MTRFWLFILVCGVLMSSLTTAFAPKLLAWYATPPVDIGVSCDSAIQWGMSKLVMLQMIGSGVGAFMGAMLFFWIRGKRQEPKTVTPPATP